MSKQKKVKDTRYDPEIEETIDPSYTGEVIEFEDKIVNLFLKLHRFKILQMILLFIIRAREKLNLSGFIEKPITIKGEEDMDNCHFRTLFRPNTLFRDDFTDPDFLSTLKINTNLKYYTLTEAIVGTTRVSINICTCVLYFIIYYHLGHDNVSPPTVFQATFSSVIVGYLMVNVWRFWNEKWNLETLMKVSLAGDLRVSFLCIIFSYFFTPMLRTLTNTIDGDTVHAWCWILFGVHLLCSNYGLSAYCVSHVVSTNSAIFAMCCLASRLQTDEHCLSLLAFGMACFICFPHFARMMWDWTPGSVIYCLMVGYAIYTVSPWIMVFYGVCMLMIIVVAPSMYVFFVQYKRNILGPWDEAVPDFNFDNMNPINTGCLEEKKSKPFRSSSPCYDPQIKELESRGIGKPL